MEKVLFVSLAAFLAVGSTMLVGSYRDISTNDEGALNALKYAVDQHNRQSNNLFLSQVAEVLGVRRQLVSGYNYMITVRMVVTNCRHEAANFSTDGCTIHQNEIMARPYNCTFTVWTQVWTNRIELTKAEC